MVSGPPFMGCTVTTLARLPEARVLARSFRQHNGNADFTTVIIDHEWHVRHIRGADDVLEGGLSGASRERLVTPRELGLDGPSHTARHFLWDEVGAMRAAIPETVGALLSGDPALHSVVVLAPWVEVHGALDPVLAALDQRGWSAAPKRLGPIADAPRPAANPFGLTSGRKGEIRLEADLLLDGVHTWDTLVFARGSSEVLAWLNERLARIPRDPAFREFALASGEATDRLIDVALPLFSGNSTEPGHWRRALEPR